MASLMESALISILSKMNKSLRYWVSRARIGLWYTRKRPSVSLLAWMQRYDGVLDFLDPHSPDDASAFADFLDRVIHSPLESAKKRAR